MIIWITSQEDLTTHSQVVDQFFALYSHPDNFPDPDEREKPGDIRTRIEKGSALPHTHLLAYLLDGQVRGGAILEYYPHSACCLLTYLFTDKAYRHAGIARQLIHEDMDKGIPGFIRHLRAEGRPVRAVFFESNNPLLTPEHTDSMAPADRLKAFAKMGAKRLDFAYVQPPLNADTVAVRNLYLCVFPHLSGEEYTMEIQLILHFLTEFYHSLNALLVGFDTEWPNALTFGKAKHPGFATPELQDMATSLAAGEYGPQGFTYLKQLPRLEEPRISFHRASICFELLVDESYHQPAVVRKGKKKDKPLTARGTNLDPMSGHQANDRFCTITHSFETDLYAYAYQSDQPYYTRSYNFPAFSEVIIRFPQVTEYTSEGRQEMLYVLPEHRGEPCPNVTALPGQHPSESPRIVKEVRLNVFLNYTYFFNSQIRVWHLVFTSSDQRGIDELDVIKLMKFFSGSQESPSENAKQRYLEQVRFINPAKPDREMNIKQLFTALSGIRYTNRKTESSPFHTPDPIANHTIRSGIVAIDTRYCSFANELSGKENADTKAALVQLFKNLRSNEEGQKVSSTDVENQYRTNKNAEYIFETFCGISLGIFDFDRMSYSEVSDTLIPRSATESSFLTINRGVLSSFGYRDEVLAASIGSLGINPLLMIPSALLAHNHFIARDALFRSKTALEQPHSGSGEIQVTQLVNERKRIRNLLNADLLPNVFQYPTEQDLYTYGMMHRGIEQKIEQTRANLAQIDDLIDECNAQMNHSYQFWINILLMIISIFQIYEVVAGLIMDLTSDRWPLNGTIVKMAVLVVLVAFCTMIAYRLYKKSTLSGYRKFVVKGK